MDMVAKCNCCGRPFLVDLEGDDKTCDYCLAEQEIIKGEVDGKQSEFERPES